jgi:uridine nucleosidase
MSSNAKKVWLDCDPGHDDALAILFAEGHPSLNLIGISTVSGNASLKNTFYNAQTIRDLSGANVNSVPVYRGAERPLLRSIRHDPGIHGISGLDGSLELEKFAKTRKDIVPASNMETGTGLALMMEKIILSSKDDGDEACPSVTLVATGALTNIALLLRNYEKTMKKHIKEIVIMGGAIGVGNRSPVAEFNILCDPEAAKIVFDSGIRVVMVPLEVTHTAIVTDSILKKILNNNNSSGSDSVTHTTLFRRIVVDLLTFFADTYLREFGFENGPPIHDACAIAYTIMPEIFNAKLMHVDVICNELSPADGQTVCDIWGYKENELQNVVVCDKMNVEVFFELCLLAIENCNKVSPVNGNTTVVLG